MSRFDFCTCDPSAKRDERCSKDWARCNTRIRYFVQLRRAKELVSPPKAGAK